MAAFHINVLCFVTAPHSCGALFFPGGRQARTRDLENMGTALII